MALAPRSPGPEGQHPLQRVRRERLGALDPVPASAYQDPVKWSEKHIESLLPDAVKEVEYTMKFGSDRARYEASRDILAMRGITTKPKNEAPIQQAMVFQWSGPISQQGAPIMPFSNATPAPTHATVVVQPTLDEVDGTVIDDEEGDNDT